MINKQNYKSLVKKIMENFDNNDDNELELEGKDLAVILYLLGYLNDKDPKEINKRRVASFINAGNKSIVKDSINKLIELGILIEIEEEFNSGFIFQNCFDTEEAIIANKND